MKATYQIIGGSWDAGRGHLEHTTTAEWKTDTMMRQDDEVRLLLLNLMNNGGDLVFQVLCGDVLLRHYHGFGEMKTQSCWVIVFSFGEQQVVPPDFMLQ